MLTIRSYVIVFAAYSAGLAGAGCRPASADRLAPLSLERVVPQIVDAAVSDARRSFREGGRGPLLIDVHSFQEALGKGLRVTISPDSIALLIGRPFRATPPNEAFRCNSGGDCTVVDDGVFLQMRRLHRDADSLIAEVSWSHPYRRAGTPWITCSRTLQLSFSARISWQLANQQILETC